MKMSNMKFPQTILFVFLAFGGIFAEFIALLNFNATDFEFEKPAPASFETWEAGSVTFKYTSIDSVKIFAIPDTSDYCVGPELVSNYHPPGDEIEITKSFICFKAYTQI